MTATRVTWFQREPTGGTLHVLNPPCLDDVPEPSRPARKPEAPKPGRPPRTLFERWTDLDPRIQVDPIPAWNYGTCQACQCVDCPGDVEVVWNPAKAMSDRVARMNREHVEGWLSGWVLPECGDPDAHVEPILVRVGGGS